MTTKYGTDHIGRRPAENALHAVRFAREIGLPINTLLTISFIALDHDDDQAGTLFRKLQVSMTRWWRYQRQDKGRNIGPPVSIHAHANPAGSRHVHVLLHLPPSIEVEFRGALAKRIGKWTGLKNLGDALHMEHIDTPGSVAKYALRGIDPAFGEYLHIRPANEGRVTGRRTGTSRFVGKAARRAAGWKRKGPPYMLPEELRTSGVVPKQPGSE